jgi:hypothetical protein
MDIKALKPNNKYNRSELWYDIVSYYDYWSWKFIRNPIFQMKRLIQWWWNVFRRDFDFDAHGLFRIISYKLKRVEKALIKGCAIQAEVDMKAIRIAIKLADRLDKDEYLDRAYRKHDAKWGIMKTWFTPCNDGIDNSIWNSSRPNANTDAEKEQERQDSRNIYMLEEVLQKRDEKLLYNILQKYLRTWWN